MGGFSIRWSSCPTLPYTSDISNIDNSKLCTSSERAEWFTVMPKACILNATSFPILPSPMTASVLPQSSVPTRCFFSLHWPARTHAVPRDTYLSIKLTAVSFTMATGDASALQR